MKKLQRYTNIIPILAKGDSYTPEEIIILKNNIRTEAYDNKIDWFDCENVYFIKLKEFFNTNFCSKGFIR
jgi:septin family protein